MENKDYSASNHAISILAGGLAGVSVDVGLFPIDTLKSRLQYGKIINKKISIYSGLTSSFLGSFPSAAGFFCTYDYISHEFFNKNEEYNPFKYVISACIGECVAVLIRNPFELIKQNLQVGNFNSGLEGLKSIYKAEGIRGLYRGYVITVLREIPFSIIQFPLYEYLKSKEKSKSFDNHLSQMQINKCGALAGGISAIITTPIDVIKTRIMTSKEESSVMNKILREIKEINRTDKRLYLKGVHWRTLYITVGGICFFGTNEYFKKLLGYKH